MQFGRWYPLAEAGDRTPEGEGVLQLRQADLVTYPRGKSAMVLYAHALDLRASARALATRFAGRDLLCRHLIEVDPLVDLAAFCAKLREEFERRFGGVLVLEQANPESNPQ